MNQLRDHSSCFISTDWLTGHEQFIQSYLQFAEIELMKKDQLIMRQGKLCDALYLILKGSVAVYYERPSGQSKITTIIERGALVGMSCLNGYCEHHTLRCRTAAVVAVTPADRIGEWDRDMLLSLIQMQTYKMRLGVTQLVSTANHNVQERLVRFLLEAGQADTTVGQEDIPCHIVFSKQEIANVIGSTRERVSQLMGELQRSGLLLIEGKDILFTPSQLNNLLPHR